MENNPTLPVQARFRGKKSKVCASEPAGPPRTLPSPLQWSEEDGPAVAGSGEGSHPGTRYRYGVHGLWLIALIGAVLVLFAFPPDRYPFYPRCQFHRLTGLNCPGCGSLRALHEVTHGHVVMAFRLNPLFVLALALAGV